MKTIQFSFCETATATSSSPWHIRQLTEKGPKFGGGADSPALCGRQVAWDIDVPVAWQEMDHCCHKCVESLRTLKEYKPDRRWKEVFRQVSEELGMDPEYLEMAYKRIQELAPKK